MQIVIDIPDTLYSTVMKNKGTDIELDFDDRLRLECAVEKGVSLPKGHGRLIDADALNFNANYNEPLISKLDFDNALTIIEADNVESEG